MEIFIGEDYVWHALIVLV